MIYQHNEYRDDEFDRTGECNVDDDNDGGDDIDNKG